jgi:predicted DNA-binding transcriptional regulator YafY
MWRQPARHRRSKPPRRIGRQRRPAETASAPDASGWVRVVIPIERIDHAAGELIRLGVDVEALEPQELRDRIAEMAGDVSRLYRRRRGAQ